MLNQIKARVNSDLEIRADYGQFPPERELIEKLAATTREVDFVKHLPFERGNFIIDNFSITFNHEGKLTQFISSFKYVFAVVGDIVKIDLFTIDPNKPPLLIIGLEFKDGFIKNTYKDGDVNESNIAFMFCYFYTFMMFVAFAEPDRIKVKTKKRISSGKSNKQKKLASIVTITGVIKSYDDEDGEKEKQERQKHVESWHVRGHFRKLKSGKTTWIQPHKKGSGESVKQNYRLSNKNKLIKFGTIEEHGKNHEEYREVQ